MKKNEENPLKPKTKAYACRISAVCDSFNRVKLVEQVLSTRDDTRLSLHVMHGSVAFTELELLV